MFLFVIFGVDLWIGLYNFGLLLLKLVEGDKLSELGIIEVLLFKILLNKFL